MKRFISIISLVFIVSNISAQSTFLDKQKTFVRVRAAISDKEELVKEKLQINNIEIDELDILILIFKEESELELYAKNNTETIYKKIATYQVCAKSGKLGPKRMQGDYQVPEGFYFIDRFNPYSSYYLSLGLNYPNAADRKKSNAKKPGGDIFIHGSCVTIGCIPMTDDIIKEIYLYAINAKNSGQQNIPVYIFPFRMTNENFDKYRESFNDDQGLINFWITLKAGYDSFLNDKMELNILVGKTGDYLFSN